MGIRDTDHPGVRDWLVAAERGDFAEAKAAGPGTYGEPLRGMVYPGWGGWGNGLGMGGLRSLLPGSDYDYERQAGDCWRNSAVAACLRVLKLNFPQPQLEVRRRTAGGETPAPIPKHPLVELVARPNLFYDRYALWGAVVLSLICDGNAFLLKVRSRARIPVELWWVPHWMIRPAWPPGNAAFISHYIYRPGDGHVYSVPVEDVVHLRHGGIDPHNDRLGLADLKAGLRAICGLNDADGYTASLLRNGGVPTVIIEPIKDVGRAPTAEQAAQMKDDWRRLTTGEGRGDPYIPAGPFTARPLGWSPEQLALDKIPARLEDQACALTGVNAMVAGLTSGAEHKTYANVQESRKGLYEELIYPMQDAAATCLELQLLGDPGMGDVDTQEVGWNYKGIPCLQEDQDRIWTRAGNAYQRDKMITRGQAKEMVGLPWDDEDEVYADAAAAPEVGPDAGGNPDGPAPGEADDAEGTAPGIVEGAQDDGGEDRDGELAAAKWLALPLPNEYPATRGGHLAYLDDMAPWTTKGFPPVADYAEWSTKYNHCHGPDGRFCGGKPGGKPGHGGAGAAGPEAEKPAAPAKPDAGKPKPAGSEKPTTAPAAAKPTEKPKPGPEAPKPEAPKPAERGRDLADASPKEVDAYHKEMSGDWSKGLSTDQQRAANTYSSSAYGPMNSYNRTGKPPKGWEGAEGKKSLDNLTKNTDAALAKASLKEPVTVYRGVGDLKSLGLSEGNLKGAVIHDKAFLSTSLTPKVAEGFAGKDGAILKITAPKGSKGASMAGVAVKHNAKEKEVLFARGSKLTITGHSRDKKGRLVLEATLSHG